MKVRRWSSFGLMAIPLALGWLVLPSAPEVAAPPAAPREFRAAWVATVDNIDWPSKPGLSTAQQQAELLKIFEVAQEMNLNALVLQVRPSCCSLYQSSLEPWSEYLTGQQGKAPDPAWDPLEFAVAEAHKRGMELHAWFNPYRAWHPAAKGAASPDHIGKKKPHLVRKYGSYQWLDPGEPEVQDWSLNVILDVVKRYDLDGVHIDDYFYPYPVRQNGSKIPFPDERSWNAYRQSGGKLSRDDWRRANVDSFVKRLYEGIKAEKRWVKFGISPFGIYRPGVPSGIKAGIDQYADLYADAKKWLENGWCDYFTPQLYWKIDPPQQSYPELLDWWIGQNKQGRHMWVGNMSSNLSVQNWPAEELIRQVEVTRKAEGATGNVFFSMKAFTLDYKGVKGPMKKKLYAEPAMVPASRWLDGEAPPAPKMIKTGGALRAETDCWLVARYLFRNDVWSYLGAFPAQEPWTPPAEAEAVAFSALNRVWNESERVVVPLR